ncbi:MAG: DNA-3-methyladenine glycosylase [Phycisphaerales bacterium]|nr:MAG: DNA-3-methyladenine glycosylase [Phycisphaerales bacterium]
MTRWNQYAEDAVTVARGLLGQRLVRIDHDGRRVAGIIVETEAYLGPIDRAAHSFNGHRSPRNESMYLEGGHAYVYFIYGMHHCFNVVCGRQGDGTAVLIRALEPTEGVQQMRARRAAARRDHDLCSGPARLTQALAIDRSLDGVDLRSSPEIWIERASPPSTDQVLARPRIGVDYAGEWADRPLRFLIDGSEHVSRR